MGDEQEPLGGVGQTIIGDGGARKRATGMLLDLADQMELEEKAVTSSTEPMRTTAMALQADGDTKTAATLYLWVAEQYRKAGFHGAADQYARTAKECRRKRRTGK
jgi:hypothetical protein